RSNSTVNKVTSKLQRLWHLTGDTGLGGWCITLKCFGSTNKVDILLGNGTSRRNHIQESVVRRNGRPRSARCNSPAGPAQSAFIIL
ncbi:hypothetical protein MJO28_005481, partial [Puccinia striiformis f. sp. tritici]